MKTKISIICTILFIFASCRQTENKSQHIATDNDFTDKLAEQVIPDTIDFKSILSSEITDTSKMFEIKDDGIFFVQLTDAECDSIEKADEQAYERFSEEANNTSTSAGELLTNLKIKQYWSEKRFVKFELGGKKYYIDTRKNEFVKMSGCILFKKEVNPMVINAELVTEKFVKKYYKK